MLIRAFMESWCASKETWEALSSYSRAIGEIFDALIEIIRDPTQHDIFFARESERTISELEQLLNQCSLAQVPDYFTFYQNVGKVLNRGYSEKVLDYVAKIAGNFFVDIELYQSSQKMPNHDAWMRFQKYKLMRGFIESHMTEPARALFLKALDRSLPESALGS